MTIKLINGLQCGLDAVQYDYRTGEATLYFPEGECCDMRGAIAYAVYHFAGVSTVKTVSGTKPDVVYRRHAAEWEARLPA